jgi:hypothetical protein
MGWERDYPFKQTTLAVRKEDGSPGDTFCTALVVGWLTEEAAQRFRSMHSDQLDGLNHAAMALHRGQVALRRKGREVGLPELVRSRGLSRHTSVESDRSKATPGRGFVAIDLANAVLKLHSATRLLIEVQGSLGSHAFGVRQKPTKMEFFDPNHGVYYGERGAFPWFLAEHLRNHYGTGLRDGFLVTSLVSA